MREDWGWYGLLAVVLLPFLAYGFGGIPFDSIPKWIGISGLGLIIAGLFIAGANYIRSVDPARQD